MALAITWLKELAKMRKEAFYLVRQVITKFHQITAVRIMPLEFNSFSGPGDNASNLTRIEKNDMSTLVIDIANCSDGN